MGWEGGSGIWGRFGHADRRALIGPKSLYYSRFDYPHNMLAIKKLLADAAEGMWRVQAA